MWKPINLSNLIKLDLIFVTMMFNDAQEITHNILTQVRIFLALLNYWGDAKYLFDQKYPNISDFRSFIEYLVKY